MTRHLDPPTQDGQISETKVRVYDLERRLNKKEKQKCCGETQMYGTDSDGIAIATTDISGTYTSTPRLAFATTAPFTRVKLSGRFTMDFTVSPGTGYRVVSAIVANNSFEDFYIPNSVDSFEAIGVFQNTFNLETVVDVALGAWFIYLYIVVETFTLDCDGSPTGYNPYTGSTSETSAVGVFAVLGQELDQQELWPTDSLPA